MTRRRAAFGLAITAIVLSVTGVVLSIGVPHEPAALVSAAVNFATALAMAMVGFVLVLRQPRNPIGWLFGWLALLSAADAAALAYAVRSAFGGTPLPGAEWVAWFAHWTGRSGSALVLLAFLLFPTGHLLSPRWRPALVLAPLAALGFAARAFVPGPMDTLGLPNPLGVSWVPLETDQGTLGGVPLLIGSVVAFAQLVARYRTARGVEREQIKWLTLPVVALLGALIATVVSIVGGFDTAPGSEYWGDALYGVAFLLLPIAMAIAVLRYRLYDIDLVINRALVYGPTTALIAGAFLAGIAVLQALLRPITGGSEIAVAASTLASLALFQPLRRRIQRAVDQRFYRARYDADRTLDAYSSRVRDEVDLRALEAGLLDVVDDTMRPASISLWLRRDGRGGT